MEPVQLMPQNLHYLNSYNLLTSVAKIEFYTLKQQQSISHTNNYEKKRPGQWSGPLIFSFLAHRLEATGTKVANLVSYNYLEK
jgi:hypothetical protein